MKNFPRTTFHFEKTLLLFLFSLNCISQTQIDSLKTALLKAKHDTVKCNILLKLAETADEGEWQAYNEEGFKICRTKLSRGGLSQRETYLYTDWLAVVFVNRAYDFHLSGNYDKAIECTDRAIEIQTKLGSKAKLATSYFSLGALYQRKNDMVNALEKYAASEKLARELKDNATVSNCLAQVGNILASQGDMVKALSYYVEATMLAEKTNNKESISNCYYNLSLVYSKQKEYNKAMEYGLKALKIREQSNDKIHTAYSLSMLGGMLMDGGDMKKGM